MRTSVTRTSVIFVFLSADDTFCPTCPVLDSREVNYVETSVAFSSDCGDDDICTSDLDLRAQFENV